MKLSIPPPLCLDGLPLADLEAGGADDVVVGVEPQLQGVHGLRLGEVGDEEVDAVVVGGRQPGPAVPLPMLYASGMTPRLKTSTYMAPPATSSCRHREGSTKLSRNGMVRKWQG